MIDWFTVVAQIVNFLILVGLLKYFLYRPIVDAMDKREKEITDQRDEAEHDREQAAQQRQAVQEKNRRLDEQREQWLAKIREEVEVHRQELTATMREEVSQQKMRWTNAVREETDAFLRDLRHSASKQVYAVARRVLADLANVEIERRIVETFVSKIEQLAKPQRKEIIRTLHEGDHAAVIQTAFPLTDEFQQMITDSLRQHLFDDLDVRFEQSSHLTCGVVFHIGAYKIAWELSNYLTTFEQHLRQMLEEETSLPSPNQKEPALN